jgi:hypothetical protein
MFFMAALGVEAKVLHRQLAALTKLSTPGAIRFIQSNGTQAHHQP